MNEYKRQWMTTNAAIDNVRVVDPSQAERGQLTQDVIIDYVQRQGYEIPITFLASRASKLLAKSARPGMAMMGRVGTRILPGVGYALLVKDIVDLYQFITED
jgi:mannose/fructose/N-acetylgalactosamine-specific phosphotransferase system component IIC